MHIGSGEGWIDVTLNIVSAQGPLESWGWASWKIEIGILRGTQYIQI